MTTQSRSIVVAVSLTALAGTLALSACGSSTTATNTARSTVGSTVVGVNGPDPSSIDSANVGSSSTTTSVTGPVASATTSGVVGDPSAKPAPTTAGTMNASSVPSSSVLSTRAGNGDDGDYVPNGTYLHAIPAAEAHDNAMSQRCGDAATNMPTPTAVLGGSYTIKSNGANANSQVYSFASSNDANKFMSVYVAGVKTCQGSSTPFSVRVSSESPYFVNRRVYSMDSTKWLEIMKQSGTKVSEIMVDETKSTLSDSEIAALEASL